MFVRDRRATAVIKSNPTEFGYLNDKTTDVVNVELKKSTNVVTRPEVVTTRQMTASIKS